MSSSRDNALYPTPSPVSGSNIEEVKCILKKAKNSLMRESVMIPSLDSANSWTASLLMGNFTCKVERLLKGCHVNFINYVSLLDHPAGQVLKMY